MPLLVETGVSDDRRAGRRPRRPTHASTQAPGIHLTERESEVLAHLAQGLSNGEIAAEFVISTKTVSVHVSRILAKLGARSRGEAVAIARDRGLLP